MSTQSAMITERQTPHAPTRGLAAQLGLQQEVLDPVIEGARARGMADAFELAGQAALLLDGAGAVLHMTSHAARWMGAGLAVAGDHLVGPDATANQQLGDLIGAALACSDDRRHTILVATQDGTDLRITARSITGGRQSPFQLLKVIVLIESAPLAA